LRDQELVNALREHADWWENGDMMDPLGGLEKDLFAAADRLENQNAHIAALQQEIEKLRGQNRQLMLERNYVMSIIADVTKAGKTWMCQYCAHCKGTVSGMADCDSKKLCVMPYSQFELKRPEPPEEEK
jgi:hypothetical protein